MSTGYHDTRFMLMMLFDIVIFTDLRGICWRSRNLLLHDLLVEARVCMGFLNVPPPPIHCR
jgi:hypothetical protein